MSATLYDKYNTGDDVGRSINTAAGYWRSQIWTATGFYTATAVKVKVYRVGSPGTVTVSLYNTSGGDPTTRLAYGTFDGDAITVSTDGEWVTVTLDSGVSIESTGVYAVVLDDASSSAGNYIAWRVDTGNGYAGGSYKWTDDSGVTWTNAASDDLMFEVYGGTYPIERTYYKSLIAIANNEVWYESTDGTMVELADANGDINTAIRLSAFEAYGKIFIVNGSNKKIIDFRNGKIATADLGSNPPDFGTVLTGGTSGATMIVDYITALASACTIYGKRTSPTATFVSGETVTGTDDDGNAISFATNAAEVAAPHWYDWTVYGNDSSYGVMPNKVRWGCLYRGRAMLTDDPENPHQWYLSRQFNTWDFLYVQDDTQTPVAGNDADAGEIGDVTVSAIPYSDDYMVICGANNLYYMLGDPAMGGQIFDLSLTDGILAPPAFCWDGRKNLYVLGTNGLLMIPPGFGQPENLTEIIYPGFIDDLAYDSATHRLTMGFDRINKGILVTKTTLDGGANSNWWFDLRTQGLFPEGYPDDCGIFSIFHYDSTNPDYRKFIVGGNDGYLRIFDAATKNDAKTSGTEAIDSYFSTQPIQLSKNPHKDGSIGNIDGVTAGGGTGGTESDSDDVSVRTFVARSAEGVIEKVSANSSPKFTHTITAPGRRKGNLSRKKARGMWGSLRVGNDTAGESWGLEHIIVSVSDKGRMT